MSAGAGLTAPEMLAGDMVEVHGAGAASVARENARKAAIAGQLPEARRWLGILRTIQGRTEKGRRDPPAGN